MKGLTQDETQGRRCKLWKTHCGAVVKREEFDAYFRCTTQEVVWQNYNLADGNASSSIQYFQYLKSYSLSEKFCVWGYPLTTVHVWVLGLF